MGQSPAPLQHYDLKALAKSLKLASIDVIKTSKVDIESHWYRSIGPADLFFWKTQDKVVKHQVSLFNQVIEWNEYEGVKTGFVSDDSNPGKGEVIQFDQTVDPTVILQAIEFLSNVNNVDRKLISQFINNYSFYNRWPILSPLAVIQRFFRRLLKKK